MQTLTTDQVESKVIELAIQNFGDHEIDKDSIINPFNNPPQKCSYDYTDYIAFIDDLKNFFNIKIELWEEEEFTNLWEYVDLIQKKIV